MIARIAAGISAGAAVALLVACGSGGTGIGGTPSARGAPNSSSALAYAACIRAHGVPNFPDPGSTGQVLKTDPQQLGVSSSQLQAAQQACAHLVSPTGETSEQQQETQCAMAGDCSQAVVQQWMTGLRSLARCLRSHGEPNWPDPVITALAGHQASPHFDYDQVGIDHHSAKVLNEVDECVRITGFTGLPLP